MKNKVRILQLANLLNAVDACDKDTLPYVQVKALYEIAIELARLSDAAEAAQ